MPNSNPITVAIDARSVCQDHTGDSTYWTGLVRALQGTDSAITYLLFSNAPRPQEIPENERFRWIELPAKQNRWWSLIRFPLAAKRAGATVVHTQYNLSPLVSRGGVTTVHDVSFLREPSWFRPQDRLLLQRFVPPSMRRASRVITVSEFSKSEIAHFFPDVAHKVVVTPNACGDQVQPMAKSAARMLVEDKFGISEPFLLAVGTQWPRKNMKLVVEAMCRLPSTIPHKLLLTGKSGWGEEVSGDRIVPTGYVDDITLCALYSAASLYLAPALYEGFGITLLEAFRCGCPVLASPTPAHIEVAGAAAEIAADFTPDVWASAIARLLADSSKLSALSEAGRVREAEFTWAKTAALTEAVYREAAR